MKLKSSIRITEPFLINEIIGKRLKITLVDLNSEQEEIQEEEITYSYDAWTAELQNNIQSIYDNISELIQSARQLEYDELAEQIREKRNKLLEESDSFMCIDRLNLDTSSAIRFLASLKNIFQNNYAKYRQALRDITDQPGFPYEVEFPEKPE